MNRPTTLLWRVLLDVGLQSMDSITKDFREIESRYQSEGMSFLTIALPRLDDALTKALCRGRLTRDDFPGFKPERRHGSLPALLRGFFRRVFDRDGWLLPEPSTDAIFAIRQVTRLFKKVKLPCSPPRIKAAYERYVSNDQCLDWDDYRFADDGRLWAAVTGYLWSDLEYLSGALYCAPGVHGSGATADRRKRHERLSVKRWPERAEWLFPASAHAVSREDSPDLGLVTFLPPEEEDPVRVTQVPKTLKTPRTISLEPSYMMQMQQSIAKPLMSYLESKYFGFQSIRFTDQSVNRSLALKGSIDGGDGQGPYATIDLSDASDLVSLRLVQETFKRCAPTFLDMIEGCRSRVALLPNGSSIELKKFASMGSALCFPIESMVFFSIVLYACVKASGRRPSRRLLQNIAKDVAVYGDDIIVQRQMAPVVMAELEAFGLRVNHDKSFHTGLFRESCGGDYYNGVDVTPAYVRQWDDTGTRVQASLLVDYVSLSNSFYMKGMWHAAQYIRDLVDDSRIPLSRFPIGVLHYASFLRSSRLQWDPKLQRLRVRGKGVRAVSQSDPILTVSGGLSRAFARSARVHRDELGKLSLNYPDGVSWSELFPISALEARVGDSELPTGRGDLGFDDLPRHREDSSLRFGYWHGRNCPKPYSEFTTDRIGHLPSKRGLPVSGSSQSSKGLMSDRPYSRSLKSRWCLTPEELPH